MAETKKKGTRPGYVKVEGLDELRRDLRKMKDKLAKKELQLTLKNELREAAQVVTDAAVSRTPKRSGKLASTIRPKAALRGVSVLAGGVRGVKYAGPIAWGWPTRPNKARGWRGGPIKGYNFLFGAVQARKGEIMGIMRRAVDDIAAQVKGA